MATKTKTKTKTATATKPDAEGAPGPSVERAAAKVTGAPGDGAPMSNAERQRKWRASKKEKSAAAEPVVINVTDSDCEVAGTLGSVLWDIVGPMARLRPLNKEQEARLGKALAPLVVKYMPLLADWQYEAAAVLCIMALARETHVPKEVPNEEGETQDEHAPAAGE